MGWTVGPHSLQHVAPNLSMREARKVAGVLGEAMHRFPNHFADPQTCAHFIAQCAHESGGFLYLRELWGPTTAQAGYWRRRDLQGPGLLYPGLGYLTRGAGYIQTTGRVNLRRAAQRLGVAFPRLLALASTRRYAALMAAVWWTDHFPATVKGWTCERVTRVVNGGVNGLQSRQAYTARALHVAQFLTPRRTA